MILLLILTVFAAAVLPMALFMPYIVLVYVPDVKENEIVFPLIVKLEDVPVDVKTPYIVVVAPFSLDEILLLFILSPF
jgi:hypothetical protein